jgi:hypothetical protein
VALRTPQACTIFAGPHPSGLHRPAWFPPGCAPHACTGLHNLHQDHTAKAYQASNPQTGMISTLPGPRPSPGPCSKGQLVCLNDKTSSHRPVGPHQPATCHRRAPKLPKRHTQTCLDAKGVTSEQLRLQFYFFRTGYFFFLFFPFFKGFAAWFAVWSPTISHIFFVSFFLSSLFLLYFGLFLFFYTSLLVLLVLIL